MQLLAEEVIEQSSIAAVHELAQSGHCDGAEERPLSGVERTRHFDRAAAANDPKKTWSSSLAPDCTDGGAKNATIAETLGRRPGYILNGGSTCENREGLPHVTNFEGSC